MSIVHSSFPQPFRKDRALHKGELCNQLIPPIVLIAYLGHQLSIYPQLFAEGDLSIYSPNLILPARPAFSSFPCWLPKTKQQENASSTLNLRAGGAHPAEHRLGRRAGVCAGEAACASLRIAQAPACLSSLLLFKHAPGND